MPVKTKVFLLILKTDYPPISQKSLFVIIVNVNEERKKGMKIHTEKFTNYQVFNRTASPSSSKSGLAASQDVRLTSLANNKRSSEKAVINITVAATAISGSRKDCDYAVP